LERVPVSMMSLSGSQSGLVEVSKITGRDNGLVVRDSSKISNGRVA
jgi:hypothetical protein